MEKEIDYFLSNECMEAIIDLAKKNPNDMDLGNAIRSFILTNKTNNWENNQLRMPFDEEN